MKVTPRQIELVQTSWESVVPIADAATGMFYDRLFQLGPELRLLFPDDLTEQRRKLATMLNTAVRGLNNLEAIIPAVQMLGARHATYGVTDADYDTVAAALLWTLRQGLGPAFSDEVKEAWTDVYGLLAGTMKDAAREATAKPA